MLTAIEAGKTFTSLSKSRDATTLRQLVREVATMTNVSKEEMILPIDWIRGGIPDPKIAWRKLLAEKAQLISTGEGDFEALESGKEEHKSAANGADHESGEHDEIQEVAPEDTGARGDPDDGRGDSDGDAAGYRRADAEGSRGGRLHQDISVDYGKCLPKLPRKTLPILNGEQRVLDF